MSNRLLLAGLIVFSSLSVQARVAESNGQVAVEQPQIVFTGRGEVVDGDTLWLGIHKIRLDGIDAAERDETCTKDGKKVACFGLALDELKKLVSGAELKCEIDRDYFGKPKMSHNRYLATCHANGVDVARAMVLSGWAKADGYLYRQEEGQAKISEIGLHAMTLVASRKRDTQCAAKLAKCEAPQASPANTRSRLLPQTPLMRSMRL